MPPPVYRVSYDLDPNVKVSVVLALSRMSQQESAVGVIAIERLTELLESYGVNIPLHTLNQLSPDAIATPGLNRVLQYLRNNHQSRRVRQRAAKGTAPACRCR
jgi:hypothetical protein